MQVTDLITLNERLRSEASSMYGLWRQCGQYCLTRKLSSLITSTSQSGTQPGAAPTIDFQLLNDVAVDANAVLASGCMEWIMPSSGRWINLKPASQQEGNDAVEDWLQSCTDVILTALLDSNFYTRAHEAMLDSSTFGISGLWAEEGSRGLNFRTWDVGSFVFCENSEGYVDTVFREVERTAKQASEEFTTLPPQVTRALASNKPNDKFRFLHCFYPRPAKERKEAGPQSMPIASVWIHIDSKTVCKDSGYNELPAFISRYLRWSEASAYGVSPAMQALAEIRGVNYLERIMGGLAETTLNPRLVIPQGFQGVPDLRPGGQTMGGISKDSSPYEWMTGGNFNVGLNLIERKEEAVRRAFHYRLFRAFEDRKGDMNIPHVLAIQAEQVLGFSPAFTSLTTELINPVVERCFMLLYRSGKLPKAPREAFVTNALGASMLLFPRIAQNNRMSLAMQSAKEQGMQALMGIFAPLAQTGSPVLDNLDEDRAFRDIARGRGLPADYLKPEATRDTLRQARQQAQQAQQQQAMLLEAAKNPEIVKQAAGAMQGGMEEAA
jgi:hypothetical protein